MSDAAPRWRLERVEIRDVLGFQGTQTFDFRDGLQVIEAPNHTGKTTIALSMLWCLTGEVPALPRIHKARFRMTNRHSGENAEPRVVLQLTCGGKRMTIERAYRKGKAKLDEDLTVDVGDDTVSGGDAQAQIFTELGVKPGSLVGCGVVLQDHRLKLITGKDSDVGDVINDMLGLYNLSRLVPVLDERSKAASGLQKEVANYLDAADPLQRWEQRDRQLQTELEEIENRALAAGFDRGALEAPDDTARAELGSAASMLGESLPDDEAIDAQIERLWRALADLRKQGPEARELGEARARSTEIEGARAALQQAVDEFLEHDVRLTREAQRGDVDLEDLAASVASSEAQLAANKQAREDLVQENSFLDAAYAHLLTCTEAEACPLCETAVDMPELTASVKARLAGRIASEIDRLQREDEDARSAMDAANNRIVELQKLSHEHAVVLNNLRRLASGIWSGESPDAPDEDALFADAQARELMASRLRVAVKDLDSEYVSAQDRIETLAEQQSRIEEDQLQPAERMIQKVNDHLNDLVRMHHKIEEHSALRDKATADRTGLEELAAEAKAFASRLKKIARALTDHEQSKASAAVRAQLPRISSLFGQVADNPDYDGLDIETRVAREKVTYQIKATSSSVGNLNDDVGHVLSEGDLSAASMALLIGLAAGPEHKMGFLLLDDPAQGMDEDLQANLAQAMGQLGEELQLIVLTHQESFASALAGVGASHEKLGTWKGGHLGDD